jgi:DNA-directed RNA polymerase I, II, and III subunit RPABC5
MLIPVKCFSCGEVLADRYRYFKQEVMRKKLEKLQTNEPIEPMRQEHLLNKVTYLTRASTEEDKRTIEAEVLDQLQLHKQCCRRHMLTHVDIE